jgi:hypothetical protein
MVYRSEPNNGGAPSSSSPNLAAKFVQSSDLAEHEDLP